MTFFRLLRRHFLVVFGAFFLCAGVVLLITGVVEALRERRFEKSGVVVNAVVVNKSLTRASRDGSSSTKYEIAYRFVAEDGRPVEGVDVVDVEEWERLEPGRPFKVTYLPGTPERSRAEGSGGIAGPLIMTGLGIVFTLVGGVLFVATGSALLRAWRLLRTGEPARASVIAIRESNVTVNRRRQWEIVYRYEDHLGRAHEGSSGPVPPREADALAEGETIEVRFDRAHPEHSAWIPPEVQAPGARAPRSRWARVRGFVVMLAIAFTAIVIGEQWPAMKAVERGMARHEGALLALTVAMTFLGFTLFMGGIIYRVFFGRTSSEKFTLRAAKEAWRGRAWRTNARWRSNFIVVTGVVAFMIGLFGIFIVTGPAGIKLLLGAALAYAALRTIGALARA